MTEWSATVHATGCLCPDLLHVCVLIDLFPVCGPVFHITLRDFCTRKLQETFISAERLRIHFERSSCQLLNVLDVMHRHLEEVTDFLFFLGSCWYDTRAWKPFLEELCSRHAFVSFLQRVFEVHRENTHEFWQDRWPAREDVAGNSTASESHVFLQQHLEVINVVRVCGLTLALHAGQFHHLRVHLRLQCLVRIPHPRHTATHSRSEVGASWSQDCHTTTRHVLTTVISGSFCDCPCSAVTDSKSLCAYATHKCDTHCCPVECSVADDHVLMGLEA
mmetsp:Transcript_39606/g.71274  ORF Transcript_39606/g.71274 Transcript_39606/m.71274 type:complete len:276 (+) Transcript_39606:1492-2319(+)